MGPARNILLVEDENTLRLSMARGLSKLPGVEVGDAATVREAKALLHRSPPDLVISDLDLPDGSGIEVAVEMERLGIRVPVVYVSAYVGKFRHRLPTRGDVEVFEKPLALEKLRSVVEQKLGLAGEAAPISPFGVADYVQLASMGRHSVVIDVRCAGGGGRIVIKGGEAWSAQDRLGTGLPAFRRLAFLGAAQVTCRTLGKNEIPARNVAGSAESVLLEIACDLDESGRAPAAAETVDDGWGDVFLDSPARRKTTRPPPAKGARRSSVCPPPPSATPVAALAAGTSVLARRFDDVFERGVDALLAKDYATAYAAFLEANDLSPDDRSVQANLARLRSMGFS